MAESIAYRHTRRKLLIHNPYFQEEVLQARRRLGIPENGFTHAVDELTREVPVHRTGLPLGKPDLKQLRSKACQLNLPLDARMAEWDEKYARSGTSFEQAIQEFGWGALPIFSAWEWAGWWADREAREAGLGRRTGGPADSRLPSNREALSLANRFRLGEDYVPKIWSLLLEVPPGGGEADVQSYPREDGAGIHVTFPSIPWNCTKAEWTNIFDEVILPLLLQGQGKVLAERGDLPAIEAALKQGRPGRPPSRAQELEDSRLMWEFCYQEGWLDKNKWGPAWDAFLSHLPEDDRARFETVDINTFRRNVQRLERWLRPDDKK